MVNNHGFVDGNKRTSWILVELLLDRSGYQLDIPEDEPVDDLVVAVAERKLTYDEICEWFRQRLVRRK